MSIFFKSKQPAAAKSAHTFDGRSGATVTGQWFTPDPGMALGSAWLNYTVWASQPSVRKVVGFIARNAASTPLRAYKRTGKANQELLTEHPIVDLLTEPAKYQTAYRFWYDLIVDLMVYDRFMARLVPSADTKSGWELQRQPIPTWSFLLRGFEDVRGVQLNLAEGGSTTIGLDGVLWDRGYGAGQGVPPIQTLSQVLEEQTESVKYRRSVWKNSARVPAVITRPVGAPALSTTAQDRLEKEWANYVNGGGREGAAPILQEGMNIAKVDIFSARDNQEVEGRTLADVEVASAYHVPPEMVGARQANYSSMQAFRDSLHMETLGALYVSLEQAFNVQLLPFLTDDASISVKFDLDEKLRGSFLEQAEIISQAVGGPWMSVNEARAKEDMSSLGPEYDAVITPLNVVRGGGDQASPQDADPAAQQQPLDEMGAPVNGEGTS